MSAPLTPKDIVLSIVRQQLAQPELSFEQALEHPEGKLLFEALSASSEANDRERPTPQPERVLTPFASLPGVIKTAINATYLLDEVDVEPHVGDALLSVSHLVMVAGWRRLRLQDAERAAVIGENAGKEPYLSILRGAVEQDMQRHEAIGKSAVELPSAWVRCFLSGEFRELETAPPKELKAALTARECLRYVDNLPTGVPSVVDLERQVGMAELLDPLRLLIGAEGGWDGTERRDRFVGRNDELRRLRAFVDELSSKSATEFVTRAAKSIVNVLSGSESSGIMIVTARGGLGKSTLLAKFVLDHALDQTRPFPFAYLDFDRAGIDPERPRQLLAEIARQVGLQFPAARPKLSRLNDDMRAQAMRPAAEVGTLQDISDPFARFAEILRDHVTHGERAFLLVLDTLEIVQWNATAMTKLAEIVDEFRRKGLRELRVVASGRADVPELRRARGSDSPAESIELKPLLVREARTLADDLGVATLGSEWRTGWAAAIAGTASDSDVRREPLAVRVATDLVARTEPGKREEMISQIRKAGVGAADDFVARLYEKRILNHVQDKRAQKLAWPGLVVRRVTSEIVRELLAPLCDISPDEADAAFLALGQEIWMVIREDAAGSVLRHRPDLRARTLPLMRRWNQKRFHEINRAAIKYFSEHRSRSLDDYGEWIYHRMLDDEPMATVERDLTENVLPMLAKAEADFLPDSAAASYIAARTAQSRLSPKRIRELQPADALRHLSMTSSGTFALDDADLDRVAIDVASRVAEAGSPGPQLEAWARALWIKVGSWQKIPLDASFDELPVPVSRLHAFWAARMAPRLGQAERGLLLERCLAAVGRGEQVGLRTTVQALALARLEHSPFYGAIDGNVSRILASTKSSSLPSMQAALRTAIVLGKECRLPALELWLSARRRGNADRVRTPTLARRELDTLASLHPKAAELFGSALGPSEPARFADDRTVNVAASCIDDLIGDANLSALDALSRLYASRAEDWIVPFAYTAARARIVLSAGLSKRLEHYAKGAEVPTDMVGAFRFADEAGDFPGFVELVAGGSQDSDLLFLLDAFRAWSGAIDRELGVNTATDSKAAGGASPQEPPEPPPIVHKDDVQKDRWGGQPERDGRALRASVASVEGDTFYFSLIVESTDGSLLEAPVIFHLHDTYPQNVIPVTRVVEGRHATLRDVDSFGIFAVGAQVKDRSGRWTSLELDLRTLPGLPKRFLAR